MNNQPCFCGSKQTFSSCCLPFISQKSTPEMPEQLMRSRYSAFNVGDVNYLINSLSAEKRCDDDFKQLKNTIETTEWLGLKIINTHINEQLNTGVVEFVAFYRDDSVNIGQLHEKSNFSKIDNYWFYVDGEHLPPIKIGRNENCFCSSGKKYKKCHANNSSC